MQILNDLTAIDKRRIGKSTQVEGEGDVTLAFAGIWEDSKTWNDTYTWDDDKGPIVP